MRKIDETALLAALTTAQQRFIVRESPRSLFNSLLDLLLELTGSGYGFIGEVLYDRDAPYLKTHAITDISWNEDTRRFYREGAPRGLEFTNLDTLFGQVIVTSAPVIANSPCTDPRRGGLPKGHPEMRAFLGLPFYADGKLNGMVGIANRPGGYDAQICDELAPFSWRPAPPSSRATGSRGPSRSTRRAWSGPSPSWRKPTRSWAPLPTAPPTTCAARSSAPRHCWASRPNSSKAARCRPQPRWWDSAPAHSASSRCSSATSSRSRS